MTKNILFIQGGGDDGFEADKIIVASLQKELGNGYTIAYPRLASDETLLDFGWPNAIGNHLHAMDGDVILIAHSLGASMLLKYLSENKVTKNIRGIFLMATPYWSGDEDWVQGLKLSEDFVNQLPENIPIHLYHCQDDEEVPFNHLSWYRHKLPHAITHAIPHGGHQFNNNLSVVANNIKTLP